LVLSCTNTPRKALPKKYFLYCALKFLTLRHPLMRRTSLESPDGRLLEFESIYDEEWQRIPEFVSTKLAALKLDLIIKFGMPNLRIDDALRTFPIVCFSHMDLFCRNGKPAGFYELLYQKNSVSIAICELTDNAQYSKVWAAGYSKIARHSYQKTVINCFNNSIYLLRKAIQNISANVSPKLISDEAGHRRPRNCVVLKFLFELGIRKLKRLAHFAFFEKKWNIAVIQDFLFCTRAVFDLR